MTKDELNQKLFSAADILRGKMDAADYKNYLLALLFYKYISETFLAVAIDQLSLDASQMTTEEQIKAYEQILQTEDKEEYIQTLETLCFYTIRPEFLNQSLLAKIESATFQLRDLRDAFTTLSSSYKQFEGLFDMVNLDSTQLGLNEQQRNITICDVMKKLNQVSFEDYKGDVIGDAYEYLISQFAQEAGKKAGEFYTPHEVSDLMTRIVTWGQEDTMGFTIYDPTMGSGSLMLNARKYLKHPMRVQYFGQEMNHVTYNLARMNLILHNVDTINMHLRFGDTLSADWPTEEPRSFDAVVMNPPYSAKWSASESFLLDERFNRYSKLAPKSKADFAFLQHGYFHLKESGTMGIVLPHGVLFRGAAEGVIRKKMIEDGSIDAVIGLPANLFTGTSIPTTIIILKKERETRDVLFIDASHDFKKEKNQNKLTEEHIQRIVDTYKKRENVDKFAYVASLEEIQENDYNLNIPRYVDTFEEEAPIDLKAIGDEMAAIRKEKAELEKEIVSMIQDLEYSKEDENWIKGALEVFGYEKQ